MLIRDYREDDFPALVGLWQATGLGSPERGDNAAVIEKCNALGGKLLVMEEPGTGRLVGSSWMTFDGRRMYLHHFGISPDLQNRGWGKKLLEASLEFLKEQGQQVKLEVHTANDAAIHLYRSAGFFDFKDYSIYMIRNIKAVNYHP